MAQGRGFAAGLADGLEKIALREQAEKEAGAKQALAQQEASRKQLADTMVNVSTVRDQAFEIAGGINEQLIAMSRIGQLDPELASQMRSARDSTLSELALVYQDTLALAASDPNTDPTALSALASGQQFLVHQRNKYESEILGAFADSPQAQGRAEAIAKIAAYETAVGRKANSQELKRLFGVDRDPRVVNFLGPGGEKVSVDMTAPGAQAEVDRLTKAGYWAVAGQLQGQDISAFTDKTSERDFNGFQKNTVKLYAETRRLRQQASEGDHVYTGLMGGVLGGLNTTISQFNQFSRFMGGSVDEKLLNENGSLSMDNMDFTAVFDAMEEAGIDKEVLLAAKQSRAYKFNLFGLAFMLARMADPNDRLSAQEVQFQISALGSGELSTLGAILDEVDRRAAVALDAEVQVLELRPDFDINATVLPSLRPILNNHRTNLQGPVAVKSQSADSMIADGVKQATETGRLSAAWMKWYGEQDEETKRRAWDQVRKASRSK
jgi:hypothetical protein